MPDRSTIAVEVVRLIGELIGRPGLNVPIETPLADVPDFDSLRAIECVALAERHFGVEVSAQELDGLFTVGDIIEVIGRARSSP